MGEEAQIGTSPYIGVKEVAARFGMSTRGIYELTRTRGIPHRLVPGIGRLLFLVDELEQWEAGAELEVIEPPRGGRIVRPSGTPPVRPPSRRRMSAAVLAA